ncbi:hypothetical protein [Mycobacterium sp.]|uniref:hypothetical protein n=1 Tax=Mycobacterium sp. TaxID=1785 RepID=UPI0012850941|nr:hypothetical protein [Mycobacterium sp.]KAA8960155.1 MAG: hypothetical protein F6Q13_14190 [Mycobacterium sp.]
MTRQEMRLLVVVVCGAAATCLLAGWLTHNHTSTPLTLSEVLVPALIPAGLLGYVTVYYRRGTSQSGGRRDQSTTEGR